MLSDAYIYRDLGLYESTLYSSTASHDLENQSCQSIVIKAQKYLKANLVISTLSKYVVSNTTYYQYYLSSICLR